MVSLTIVIIAPPLVELPVLQCDCELFFPHMLPVEGNSSQQLVPVGSMILDGLVVLWKVKGLHIPSLQCDKYSLKRQK